MQTNSQRSNHSAPALAPTLTRIKPKGAAILLALRQSAPCTNRMLGELTGMTGKTIASALELLAQSGLVVRGPRGWVLTARALDWFENGRNFSADYPEVKLRESERKDIKNIKNKNSLTDSLKTGNVPEIFPRKRPVPPCPPVDLPPEGEYLLRKLKSQGVYHSTAVQLVQEHEPDDIRLQLLVYKWAVRERKAHGPGYLVSAIREDWELPYEYDPGIPRDECLECGRPRSLCRCTADWL